MRKLKLAALAALIPAAVAAAPLVVLDARGGGLKAGQSIDSAKAITLKEGERVSLIGPDGRMVQLRGPYSGPAMKAAGSAQDPKLALAALISTRNARSSAIGAIRAGIEAKPLPDPWLIDISRPGARCLKEGETPVWWRPESGAGVPFTVQPVDKSWKAQFAWDAGAQRMLAPRLSRLEGATMFIISSGGQDNAISINVIPKDVADEFVLASWMIEKGCIQQADAFLKRIAMRTGAAG